MQTRNAGRALRTALAVASLWAAAACGDGPTASGPRYPDVAGVYDVSAPVTEVPGARFTGTITVADDSRETPGFTGTYSVSLIGPDNLNYGNFSGDVVNASVAEGGTVSFNFDDSWFRWTGTMSGRSITGTWILVAPESNYSGTFTASRR